MQRRWRIVPHDAARVEQLSRTAKLPAVVAQLLVSRGIYQASDAANFLSTKLASLRDPNELPGVPVAVEVIAAAMTNQSPVTVYGDYDADGMTGTAILFNALRLLGADVSYHVPNRLEDGYGLSDAAIAKLAKRGKKLIISVDCGITSRKQAALCRELGIKLVITDHHTIDGELPLADAIVHPRLPGTAYPFGELCGAGVAFKLAWALCQRDCGGEKIPEPMRIFLRQALALAAIGTVADVVPLIDENRVIVEHGLRALLVNPPAGLAELMKVTKLDQASSIKSDDIAFTLAPRLNAAGRLGQAQLAVELLTTPAGERAVSLAEYIHSLNSDRDTLQRSVTLAAQKQIKDEFDGEEDSALVLCGVGWHAGVIGVVAGRLAEKYAKPVLVLSLDTTGKCEAVGSGRVGGTDINLFEALRECSERLIRFGGHQAAAGLTIDEKQIDAFRGDFCEAVSKQWNERKVEPEIVIDAEASLGQLNMETAKHIEMLAPFGAGNPRPVLFCQGIELEEPARRMGGGDRHLSVLLRQGAKIVRGVAFGAGDWCDDLNELDQPFEIAYRPIINEFRGMRKVEIHLVDWRISAEQGRPTKTDKKSTETSNDDYFSESTVPTTI